MFLFFVYHSILIDHHVGKIDVMYVCMYVCVYMYDVCMYVPMYTYVCMYVRMYGYGYSDL